MIKADDVEISGNQIRVKFKSSSTANTYIINPTIGERLGSTWDFSAGTLVNLTFEGVRNYTLPAGSSIWTDWVNFNYSEVKDYLISHYKGSSGGATDDTAYYTSPEKLVCFKSGGDYTSGGDWTSCTSVYNIFDLYGIEVYGNHPFLISVLSPLNNSHESDGVLSVNYVVESFLEKNIVSCSLYTNLSGWDIYEMQNISTRKNLISVLIFENNIPFLFGIVCTDNSSQEYFTENYIIFTNFTFVTYGDSITLGVGASTLYNCTSDCLDWSYLLANSSNLNYYEINSGQSSTRINDTGVANVENKVTQYLPKAVFIQYGLNDFRYGVSEEDFENAYKYVVEKILNTTNTTLILGTITHMSGYSIGAPTWDKGNKTIHGKFNNIIQEIAVKNNLSVSQVYYEMNYNNNFLSDGIHPNDAGHALIARIHNQTYWARDTQSPNKWDVYSSVANFTFMNYTFNMPQHPHETNTTFIIEDMQLYNFSVNTTQVVEVNTSVRYSPNTQYYIKRTSLNDGSSSTSIVTSDLSGRLQLTIPVGNYTYNISLFTIPIISTEKPLDSSGSGIVIFNPSKESLQKGYSVNITKNQKVEIPVGDDKKIIGVKNVSEEKVVVSVDGKSYEIPSSSSGKIDLNEDGFYDIEIINDGIIGKYANLKFILINEEIPREELGGQEESIIEEEIPEIVKRLNWKKYILICIVILLIVVLILFKKSKKRKRYKKFGH